MATVDYEACREKYRPERVRLLFVGESRPANGTFFYCANSNLYRHTKMAFEEAYERTWDSGEAFLEFFRASGCFLIDLHEEPVNHLPISKRRKLALERVEWLADQLRALMPARVVTTPKTVTEEAVAKAVQRSNLNKMPVHYLPFPAQSWQECYRRELVEILRDMQSENFG